MNIIIHEPLTEKKEKTVYNPVVENEPSDEVKIMRISEEDDMTRIDFVYPVTEEVFRKYEAIDIKPKTFIRPCGSNIRLYLVRACGIPFAPAKYMLKGPGEMIYFTLFFPLLPKGTKAIDMIEIVNDKSNPYNIYGISLETIQREVIAIQN
ncbi:MAG: hypothetical protein Fur0041_21170 [Bacteroidia bacterium]